MAPGFTDGVGTSANFGTVQKIAADAAGNVFVTDSALLRLRSITPGGAVGTVAGCGLAGYQNGPAAGASFATNMQNAVAVDAAGRNIYVAEAQVIRWVSCPVAPLAAAPPPEGAYP